MAGRRLYPADAADHSEVPAEDLGDAEPGWICRHIEAWAIVANSHHHLGVVRVGSDVDGRARRVLLCVGQCGIQSTTPEIISRVGAMPTPQTGTGPLNRTQQVYVWSYARTFTDRMVENKRIEASAAAYRLEESGADATRARRAADYWASVAAHAAQVLA